MMVNAGILPSLLSSHRPRKRPPMMEIPIYQPIPTNWITTVKFLLFKDPAKQCAYYHMPSPWSTAFSHYMVVTLALKSYYISALTTSFFQQHNTLYVHEFVHTLTHVIYRQSSNRNCRKSLHFNSGFCCGTG